MNSGPHNPWQSGLWSDGIRPSANRAPEPIASFAVVCLSVGHRHTLHTHTSTNKAMSQQRIWERWRLYPAVLTPTMRRPRVESSSPVEYIKKEVVRKHSKAKNPGTLAASSSSPSIAFYICSPFCDPSDAAPNALGSSKESAWKTTYGVAKIAVDITKESFDMFLPLKAVAGELAALIKNYEVKCAQMFRPIDH